MDVAIIPVAVVTVVFAYLEIKKRLKKRPVITKNTINETATVLEVEKSDVQYTNGRDHGIRDFEITLLVQNTEFGERNIVVTQKFKFWLHPEVGDLVEIVVEVGDTNNAVILFDSGKS